MSGRLGFVCFLLCAAVLGCRAAAVRADAKGACQTGDFLYKVDKLADWQALASFYHSKPACPDENVYALAYTDVVMRIFSQQWNDLGELQRLTADDSGFGAFVLDHIDVRAAALQLRKTQYYATTLCPAGAASLCTEIAARASAALAAKTL